MLLFCKGSGGTTLKTENREEDKFSDSKFSYC